MNLKALRKKLENPPVSFRYYELLEERRFVNKEAFNNDHKVYFKYKRLLYRNEKRAELIRLIFIDFLILITKNK